MSEGFFRGLGFRVGGLGFWSFGCARFIGSWFKALRGFRVKASCSAFASLASVHGFGAYAVTHGPLSSSFLGLPDRVLKT